MSQAGVQELPQPLAGLATGKVMVSPSLSFPGGGRALSGAEGGILTGVPGVTILRLRPIRAPQIPDLGESPPCGGVRCAPTIPRLRSSPLAPQNVTVFGYRVFKEIMTLKEGIKVSLNPICLISL